MNSLAVIATTLATCCPPEGAEAPFATAVYAPAGVQSYVHITGAGALRKTLSARPIGAWAGEFIADGALPGAWARLAACAEIDGGELFDESLGRCVTIVTRSGEGAPEWAVLADVDPPRCAELVARLRPRVIGPVGQLSVFHVPEHELVFARYGRRLLIGPSPDATLFFEMVPNLKAPPERGLAAEPAVAEGEALGRGRAALYLRHDPPLGGWSVAVADVRGDTISIHHTAQFEHAPFAGGITEAVWSPAPIRALEADAILTFIEPSQRRGGPLEAFIDAALGDGAAASAVRGNLGPRRITTISDLDGGEAKPPFDGRLPTIARVYEVNDPARAWTQWDHHLLALLNQANQLRPPPEREPVPDPASFTHGEPRRVEVGGLAAWLFGDVPGLDRVSLNWTIASGPTGHWCVVATSPEQLDSVSRSLAGADGQGEGDAGSWTSCGTFDGGRLSTHLRSWTHSADLLVAPADAAVFRQSLSLVSSLAEGFDHGRWRLRRPEPLRVEVEVELELSEPVSEK